ncbi:MAG: malonate decarboxylase acyl carrier protein [Clostridia bacterium]|nr:malonate decarboxylase acyl carrier protein [Clostridia bacterium]
MALNEMKFEFKAENPKSINKGWSHFGVVGSGDMEILMEKMDLNGSVQVKIVTPVTGFDNVWGMVMEKFIRSSNLGDVYIEINDNNATPVVVSMRLRQALADANKQEEEVDEDA